METTQAEPKPVEVDPTITPAKVDPPTPPQDERPDRPALSPELRRALDESWEQNEATYRYLGRSTLADIRYLSLDEVIALHDEIVAKTGSPHSPVLRP